MNNYIAKLNELDADGIDFIPISDILSKKDYLEINIISSYTKEELKNIVYIPKTAYLFWKIVDGKKVYCE